MRGLFPSVVLLTLSACYNNYSDSKFEALCRAKARVTIVDQSAWDSLIAQARAIDLQDQKVANDARKDGLLVDGGDDSPFMRPLPYVPGFEVDYEHLHSLSDQREPQRDNMTVSKDESLVAVFHNYVVRVKSFETTLYDSCLIDFPELYGLRRKAVLL